METWKQSLAKANPQRILDRARTSLGHETVYKLGKGGYDPTAPLGKSCDCSGFVAWCIGVPRERPPRSNKWLQTDTFWAGGPSVGAGLFPEVSSGGAQPGDLVVYPDGRWGQGHIGIVSEVADGGITRVIHCSSNWKNHGDAILETEPAAWQNPKRKPRQVRVNYAQLRKQFGVEEQPEAYQETEEGVVLRPSGPILHPLLGNDPALRRVAVGEVVLTPTGAPVSGIGTVQDALEMLWRDHPEYFIDLGPNRKYRGFFGPKTAAAIREFQFDMGLPQTGEVDANTLVWLNRALQELKFETDVHDTIAATGEMVFTLRRDGHDWYAKAPDGKEFYVGMEVKYQPTSDSKPRRGLKNDHYSKYSQWYDAEASYALPFGHWRYVLQPTVVCESGGQMACINTYDRAYFTFGFYQFAAHMPGGDFVRYLRALLREVENAPLYFPDLMLNEKGHIARRAGSAMRDIEEQVDNLPMELMRYLNPSDEAVEEAEVLNCARFIHWCETNDEVRQIMVAESIGTAREKLVQQNTARPFNKTKHPDPIDSLCVAIIDILHHEGSQFGKIDQILKTTDDEVQALAELCRTGVDTGRNKKLLQGIKKLQDKGILGAKRLSDLMA